MAMASWLATVFNSIRSERSNGRSSTRVTIMAPRSWSRVRRGTASTAPVPGTGRWISAGPSGAERGRPANSATTAAPHEVTRAGSPAAAITAGAAFSRP